MTGPTARAPYRPGPIGRLVRLALGVFVLQAALGAITAIVGDTSSAPDLDTGLIIAIAVVAWLTPTVYDIGLNTSHGNRWRLAVAVLLAVSTAGGAIAGVPGAAFAYSALVWIAVTLGWLGVAFLVAAVLRTPGCEMRSLPHLVSRLRPGDRTLVACPGPLQPLDEWEARTSGKAEPYPPPEPGRASARE